MSEYIVDFGDTSSAFVGLAMADARAHGAELHEEIVRCRDCRAMGVKYGNTGIECWMNGEPFTVEPDGFCAWGERMSDD